MRKQPSHRQKTTTNFDTNAGVNEDYAPQFMVPTKVKDKLFGQAIPNQQQKQATPRKRKIALQKEAIAQKSHRESMSSSLTTQLYQIEPESKYFSKEE